MTTHVHGTAEQIGCCDIVTSDTGHVGIRMELKNGKTEVIAFLPAEALALAERLASAAVSLLCKEACPPHVPPVAQA